MRDFEMTQTIVLNSDYTYVNTISWKRAVTLVVKEKVEVVKVGDAEVCNSDRTFTIQLPLVVRLINFVRTIYKNKVPFSRRNVFIRDGYRCQYCGTTDGRMTIDHIMPISKGGKNSFENCVACCQPCNTRKSDKELHNVGMKLVRQPYKPTVMDFIIMKIKGTGIYEYLKELNLYG